MSLRLKSGLERYATVKPAKDFNPDKDAERLNEALESDLSDVVDLVSSRSLAQRMEIQSAYYQLCSTTLDHDIKKISHHDLERVLLALFTPPDESDARFLHDSFKKSGTHDKPQGIVEILATRSEVDMQRTKVFYEQNFGETLATVANRETRGYLKDLLLELLKESADENANTLLVSTNDAQELNSALTSRAKNAEIRVNKIFATRDLNKLLSTFHEYKQITGKEISRSIVEKFCGSYKEALLTIVQLTYDLPKYFAKLLHRSMKGLGTHDSALVRLVVTRSEIDMVLIKEAFRKEYGKTLKKFIRGDTSGDYRKLLIALIDEQ